MFEYPPDIEAALLLFLSLATSWDVAIDPLGAQVLPLGVRATEIEAEMRMKGIRKADRIGLYQDIRVMERAALKVFMSNSSKQSS